MTEKNLRKRIMIVTTALVSAVVLLAALSLATGSVYIPISGIFDAFFGNYDPKVSMIIFKLRLPRMLAAVFLGGALGVAGFLLQTFFGNPIAGPYILGISSGAKFSVALVLVFFLNRGAAVGSVTLISAAFAGAVIVMLFVLALSRRVPGMSVLIVCGVMVGYICSACTEFLITFADDSNIIDLHNWSMGSFSGISMSNIPVIAISVTLSVCAAVLLAKPMNAFMMGDEYAMSVGVDVRRFKVWLILLSSILSASAAAFAGPVSFVGIAVPHLVKSAIKTSKPIVIIPESFLGGAVFCLLSDMLAKNLFAPTELSISTVTAFFGAPVVIYILAAGRKRS